MIGCNQSYRLVTAQPSTVVAGEKEGVLIQRTIIDPELIFLCCNGHVAMVTSYVMCNSFTINQYSDHALSTQFFKLQGWWIQSCQRKFIFMNTIAFTITIIELLYYAMPCVYLQVFTQKVNQIEHLHILTVTHKKYDCSTINFLYNKIITFFIICILVNFFASGCIRECLWW